MFSRNSVFMFMEQHTGNMHYLHVLTSLHFSIGNETDTFPHTLPILRMLNAPPIFFVHFFHLSFSREVQKVGETRIVCRLLFDISANLFFSPLHDIREQ